MLIYNYQKEFIGIDEADLEVFGFANLAELKSEASDFADMFVRTPGYVHNFKHVHWIDFVTCAEPAEESKVVIEINAKTYKANIEIETVYLSDSPTSKAYIIHLNNLRGLTVKENGEISEDVARQKPKRIEPSVGFAFNAPQEPESSKESDAFDSPAVMQEMPELEGFKPFEQMDETEEVTEVSSSAPLEISLDDEPIDELVSTTTDTVHEEVFKEDTPIEIEDAYSIDVLDLDVDSPKEEKVVSEVEEDDDDFDYSYSYDPQVASDELGLPIDLIEEFIEDFIAQAKEFKDELFNSLNDGDLENVKVLSHKLKGVAANLRIEDAFNTLSIVNTSSDMTEVESYLRIFYKTVAKLSGEEIQTAKVTEAKPEAVVEEGIEDESDLYEDDLIIGFKEEDTPTESPKEESVLEDKHNNLEEEIEISIADDKEVQGSNEEFDINIKDSEVPQKIEMPELADDDFLNDTIQDNIEKDVNIEDLLSIDIEDESLSQVEETLDIQDTFEIEENVEETAKEELIEIKYSKETIASEIGLDQDSFNEIFEDYIADSKLSINSINEAISEDDYSKRKKEALKLKGMSDNMRVNAFDDQINSLINSSDNDELTNAIKQIDAAITQISK